MRQQIPTADDFRGLAFMYANLQDASVNPGGPKVDPYSTLIRTAWEQFAYQEHLAPIIPRAKLLLIDGNRELSDRPFDLEADWFDKTGIDIERFMVIGFGYFAGSLAHSSLARYFADRGHLEGKITQEECEKFLQRTAATYEQFRELSREYAVLNELYIKTEFNVLNKRPLIAIDDEIIAPVPRLLAWRISEGLYFDLMDIFHKPEGNPFLDYFGKLFEHYVGRLLKWTFGEERVIHEPVYGKGEKRGPDWIVLDGDTAMLFECRSSRLRLDSKVFGQREDLLKDTERIFLDTLRKYPGKIAELQGGSLGVDISTVHRCEAIIVTYDALFVESYFRDLARQDFDKRGLTPFEDYHVMSIVDLEALSAWNHSVPIKQVLFERKTEVTSSPAPEDFSAFLRQYSMEHKLAWGHPLLEEVREQFFKANFDIPESPAELDLDEEP